MNGQTAEVKFKGTKAWLLGTVDTSHGTADIYLDGQTEAMASITTNRVPGVTGDLNFSMELVEPTNGV